MGKRLNLSNIDSRLIDRLQNESRREHLSFNQIISEAIDFYFHQKDIERIKEDPPEPLEINLETPENKQLLKELREQKEEKQKEYELKNEEFREIRKEFFSPSWEMKEYAKRVNEGYDGITPLAIYSMMLVDELVKNYGFKITDVKVISQIPLKKIRILEKTLED